MRQWIRLLIPLLLTSLIVPFSAAHAQDDDTETVRVSPRSGRFSLAVPADWLVDDAPLSPDESAFPYDTLTVASSADTMTVFLEVLEGQRGTVRTALAEAEGAGLLLGTAFPGTLVEQGIEPGLTLENFARGYFVPDIIPEIESTQAQEVVVPGANVAYLYRYEQSDGGVLVGLGVFAPDNTFTLGLGFSDAGHLAAFEAMLDSLIMNNFEPGELLDTGQLAFLVEPVPGQVGLRLPRGWWVQSNGPGQLLLAHDLGALNALLAAEGGLADFAFVLWTTAVAEREALDEVFSGERLDDPVAAFTLMSGFSREQVFFVESATWENEAGLEGQVMQFETNVEGQPFAAHTVLFLTVDEHVLMVQALRSPEHEGQFDAFIETVLDSLTLLEDGAGEDDGPPAEEGE
jgi:hypothetical protein